MLRYFVVTALVLLPASALADKQAADQCTAALPQDAKLIYDTVAPALAPGTPPKDVVVEKTRALAQSGQISRLSARDNAMKAGDCLRALR